MTSFPRYFFRDPQSKRYFSSGWSTLLIQTNVITIFGAALVCFYLFLLRPALRSGALLSALDAPLYLALVWGGLNLIAIYYFWWDVMRASNMASEARRKKEELGHLLFEMESVLQSTIFHHPDPNESQYTDFERVTNYDDDHVYFRKKRAILWELYDWHLYLKDQKDKKDLK